MATLTTKFNVGDSVYFAVAECERKLIQCPDCLGTAKWTATLPTGEEEGIECPTCKSGYFSTGTIGDYQVQGVVRNLTIGQVGYDTDGPRYMCEETGVGSGHIYHEHELFADEAEANEALPEMVEKMTQERAECGLNQYLSKRKDNVGNMTAYYRKEIRDAKKRLESAQSQLDRIRGGITC